VIDTPPEALRLLRHLHSFDPSIQMISLTIGMNQLVLHLAKMFVSLAHYLVRILSLQGCKRQTKIPLGFRYLKIVFSKLVDLRPTFSRFRLWCPTKTTTTTTAKIVACNALNATLPLAIRINSGGTRSTTRNDSSAPPAPARNPFPTRRTCAVTRDPSIQKSRTCASTANMSHAITAAMVRTKAFHVKTILFGTRKFTCAWGNEMTSPNDQDTRDHDYQRMH
jgi:hypothetical protein